MKKGEMLNFVEQLISGSEQWNAMKLVVLGNGGIGKTTLLRTFDQLLPGSSQKVFLYLSFNFEILPCKYKTTKINLLHNWAKVAKKLPKKLVITPNLPNRDYFKHLYVI